MRGVQKRPICMFVFCLLCVFCVLRDQARAEIIIHQGKPLVDIPDLENLPDGPNKGHILKLHFFPGLKSYIKGKYKYALSDLLFFLRYPEKTNMNPRHAEFHSSANYMVGMIYFYRASGAGRFSLAKKHFEDSITWNPRNYKSYIELARLLSHADLRNQAAFVLQRLIELQPPEDIERHARHALHQAQR